MLVYLGIRLTHNETRMIQLMQEMMPGMDHGHSTAEKLLVCPECNLTYKEAEWAKKCLVWCKEHNSCNLEITKHAINKQLLVNT